MKLTVAAIIAIVFSANVAEAKPQKYGFKGNNQSEKTQEIAVKDKSVDGKDLEQVEPAAGNIQEEINKGSTINRQFKNR